MPVATVLRALALGIGVVSGAIALSSLVHATIGVSGGPDVIMANLANWLVTIGYHTALIVLASAGVLYLSRKL